MAREKLLDYCRSLNSDMIELGCVNRMYRYEHFSNEELWQKVRETVAYETIDASLDTVSAESMMLQTEFGKKFLQFLERTPHKSVQFNDSKTNKIACAAAETGFIASTYCHTYSRHAPLLLEGDTGITSVMKYNDGGEHTLLALQDDERFVAGGLYSLLPAAERSVVEAKPSEGLVIVNADEFYSKVREPLPLRLTNFVIDDAARDLFSTALNKGIENIATMKSYFEQAADTDYHAACKRGRQVLHALRYAHFDVY